MEKFNKLNISLRYFLLGKGFYQAADALEFAVGYHCGTRKDGITPEFEHQLSIAHYLRTLLPSLTHQEDTITASLLHDVTEDYDVSTDIIKSRYGVEVAQAVYLLDKNNAKNEKAYFDGLAHNEIGSIVKGADRIHNLQSMIGVFSVEKQQKYVAEVKQNFLPMLKTARRLYSKQEAAYENVKHMLKSQIELIEAIHTPNVNIHTS